MTKEFAPSPYEKNSLSLKVGDTIDVIDMNETGTWTGILNKKIGTFKFIHVEIREHEANALTQQQKQSIIKLSKQSLATFVEENTHCGTTNLKAHNSTSQSDTDLVTGKRNVRASSLLGAKSTPFYFSRGYTASSKSSLTQNRAGSSSTRVKSDQCLLESASFEFSNESTSSNCSLGAHTNTPNRKQSPFNSKVSAYLRQLNSKKATDLNHKVGHNSLKYRRRVH